MEKEFDIPSKLWLAIRNQSTHSEKGNKYLDLQFLQMYIKQRSVFLIKDKNARVCCNPWVVQYSIVSRRKESISAVQLE